MRPSLAGTIAALALACAAPAASAHVVPSPGYLEAGSVTPIDLAGPNERDEPMTGFAVTVPLGVRLVGVEPAGAWRVAEESATSARWEGGRLLPGEELVVRVRLRAEAPGAVSLVSEQRYPGGEVVRWQVPLVVLPPASESSQNLGAALAVGILGLLVLSGVALVAWVRRTRVPDRP